MYFVFVGLKHIILQGVSSFFFFKYMKQVTITQNIFECKRCTLFWLWEWLLPMILNLFIAPQHFIIHSYATPHFALPLLLDQSCDSEIVLISKWTKNSSTGSSFKVDYIWRGRLNHDYSGIRNCLALNPVSCSPWIHHGLPSAWPNLYILLIYVFFYVPY